MDIDTLKAIIDSKQVSQDITLKNLERVLYGDLKHIGNAIQEGYKIETWDGKSWGCDDDMEFIGKAGFYRIQSEEVSLGGIMIPKPETDLLIEGDEYYFVNVISEGFFVNRCRWDGGKIDLQMIKSNRIHLTEEAAQKHADALNELHKF